MNKGLVYTLVIGSLAQLGSFQARAESVYSIRDSAGHYMNLGRAEEAGRKYAAAWGYYEKAAKFDSKDADAQLAIADVCLKMNRMAPAMKALEAAAQLRPTDYATQWRLVQQYFNYGQFNKVVDIVPALHTKVPNDKGWAYMMGKSYHSLQNYGKAIDFLQISLKDDPNNAEAAYLVGRMYVQMANYKAALPYYKRALTLDSSSQPSRTYEYAMVQATSGDFNAAVKTFQSALDRGYKPRDDFYMNMAYAMADAKKTTEAINMLKEMLSRRPQDIGLLNGLADVCFHSGRYKEAIAYWDQVLGFDDKNARVLYQIGTTYIKMGNTKDGQILCDQAIGMDPSLGVLKHARQMPG